MLRRRGWKRNWPQGNSGSVAVQSLPRLVPINLHIRRGAPDGDDLRASVAVEVGYRQIFGRHAAVIHHRLPPLAAVSALVNRDAEFFLAPAGRQLFIAI